MSLGSTPVFFRQSSAASAPISWVPSATGSCGIIFRLMPSFSRTASSLHTPLVAAADAMSASRPGARRETLERYIKRLESLENIATGLSGIRQAYAIQAGREIRVIVDPETINDATAWKTARDIAQKIEDELTYPGEVKVTLLREVRCVEYAR